MADIKRQIKHERSLSRELRRQNVAHVDVCVGGSRAESIPEEGANCRGAEGGREGEEGRTGGGKRVGNDKKIRAIGPLTPWGYLR